MGYKYVDAFMLMRDMKGDKLKRILHNVSSFNFLSYKFVVTFFGLDFLLSRPDNEVKLILENEVYFNEIYSGGEILFNKTELKYIYQIYLLVCKGEADYSSFMEHISFKSRILKFQDIKWKSNTLDKFNDEHVEWSELISSYTDGTTVRRYSREFVDKIQEVISVNDVDYYPVMLTTSTEYNNESVVQVNCVRTYVNRPDCFIISLRKGDSEGNERLTNEFSISVVKDKLTLAANVVGIVANEVPV